MTSFSYTLDETRDQDPTMGLIVLQSDETIENDFRQLMPLDVTVHVSRVQSALEVTRDSLSQMEKTIPAAAGLFPETLHFDVVGYGCTSGTSVIGPERVSQLIKAQVGVKSVTEPFSALVAACQNLGVSKLAFLSPYIEPVSEKLRGDLKARGIETPVFGSFNEAEESKVVRIANASVFEAATRLAASSGCDALFLSCTNLRTLEVIKAIEDELTMPVLSSNQVLAWHMMTLAGKTNPIGNRGTLLAHM